MATAGAAPQTEEGWLYWSLRHSVAERDAAQRRIDHIEKLLRGPLVMVEAHWMYYSSHIIRPFDTVEEAAAHLTQMYEDGSGAPLGVTLGGVPIRWGAYGGTDVHEPDPSNWNFQRDTS